MAADVIEGFALDLAGWRPRSEMDLWRYCYHVAGAVGVMMARVMGVDPDDEELLDRHGIDRAHPQMTVDSEAIFALVDESGPSPRALDELRGSMASA